MHIFLIDSKKPLDVTIISTEVKESRYHQKLPHIALSLTEKNSRV